MGTRVSTRGQITIDPKLRKRLGVEPGMIAHQRVVGDHLEIPDAEHLRARPLRLLGAFAVAQAHDVPLSRTALRLLREGLTLVDDAFRSDPGAAALFLQIVRAERRVFRTLRAMNEVGLLGAFLPEWEHLVCRWQHVMYHTYTVDVHTLFLVEELRRLWRHSQPGWTAPEAGYAR